MENKDKEKTNSQPIGYQFIPVPKELYYNPEFAALPPNARHLFILIIDRLRLSETNIERFSDINGKAFVYLTLEEVMERLNVSERFAIQLFNTLVKAQLVTKKRQGLGKPNQIQLGCKGFDLIKNTLQNCIKVSSEPYRKSVQDLTESKGNNNKKNNNKLNNNHSISYDMAIDEIKEQIDYDIIKADKQLVDEIVDIMYDIMFTQANTVRVGANIYPKDAVYKRFKKLSCEDVEDVIESLERSETAIQNVRAYLISALYNAPSQSVSHYSELFARTYKQRFN